MLEPSIDWRTLLYKYVTECRNDFEGYDRRFAYRNLYLDDFSGSTVHVLVYIDVSGSIDEKILTEFMSELNGAVSAVSSIAGHVYCFDTVIHPVCDISSITTNFKLVGGGGTDFAPIVSHIATYRDTHPETPTTSILPIILTDGYAQLNLDYDTANPLLWVVSPGGIRSEDFPYGDVARIEG